MPSLFCILLSRWSCSEYGHRLISRGPRDCCPLLIASDGIRRENQTPSYYPSRRHCPTLFAGTNIAASWVDVCTVYMYTLNSISEPAAMARLLECFIYKGSMDMVRATVTSVTACFLIGMLVVSGAAKENDTDKPQITDNKTTTDKKTSSNKRSKSTAEKKSSTEPERTGRIKKRPRLPRYFGQLELMESQRSDVYSIQEEYQQQLDELTRRLAELKAERNEKLRSVLKPTQKRKLTTLQNRRSSTKPTTSKSTTSSRAISKVAPPT